ncbi:MAG TPA: DUF3093 domain-containing protein [Lacisediminihabitans sp.]|uniref:DUF3093 domain-containing protein n=1 Tax=Lacisediminihabitans sp. TaxID=2787631 RepID=UPI002ED9C56C
MTFYHERLWASAWVFISTALVIPAALLVFLPINLTAGIIVAVVLYAGIVVFLVVTAPTIEVSATQFAAGRARLPLEFVGEVEAFEGEEARLERGPRLDARAWLTIRGWVSPVVRVDVLDAQDPTPYWLVSTRHPRQMVDALSAARAALSA